MARVERVRVRVDASKCDGQGVCKLFTPEWFELDRYGYAYVLGDVVVDRSDAAAWSTAREAEATCHRAAILLQPVVPLPEPEPPVRGAAPAVPPAPDEPRLLRASVAPESLEAWRERGGFRRREPGELLAEAEAAGLRGQGGGGFPVARKWAGVKDGVFLVANGAEREPGTVKDAYLLGSRPFLVLDGALAAARDRGIGTVVIAIPDGEDAIRSALEAARDELAAADLLDGIEVRVSEVPQTYITGEETALLAAIAGEKPLPRLRPPFPAERGLNGKRTLVQNVETLSHVALVNAYGADWYAEVGTEGAAGTGLFSVGKLRGRFELYEAPLGAPLRELLDRAGLGTGAAVLVGGYSGGLIRPDQADVVLDPTSLASVGAPIGTKSIQVVDADECVLRVVTEVLRFFGGETAEQCPPCYRGLPDMADLLAKVESGEAERATIDDFRTFIEAVPGRGLCALPDGAASIALSYLHNFADDLERHLSGGCPEPAGHSTEDD